MSDNEELNDKKQKIELIQNGRDTLVIIHGTLRLD